MILLVFLALIAHVGYALADFTGALGARKVDVKALALMSWVAGSVLYFILAPFLFRNELYLWPSLVAIFTGVIFAAAWPLFLMVVEKGNATLGGVIAGTFPFWIVILSVIIYKERLTSSQGMAIAVIIVGIILSALHLTRKTRIHNLLNKYSFLALVVSLLWGVGFTAFKYPVDELGWFEAGFLNSITGSVASVIWLYPKLRGKLKPIIKKFYIYPIMNTIAGSGATLAYGLALTQGNSSLVGPIAGSYSGLYAILSYIKFKEKLTKLQILGIVVILLGIISLSIMVSRS